MDITLFLIATSLLILCVCALETENKIRRRIYFLLMVGIMIFGFFYEAQRTMKKEITIDGHKHEWIYHGFDEPVHIENECIYCIKKDSINNF